MLHRRQETDDFRQRNVRKRWNQRQNIVKNWPRPFSKRRLPSLIMNHYVFFLPLFIWLNESDPSTRITISKNLFSMTDKSRLIVAWYSWFRSVSGDLGRSVCGEETSRSGWVGAGVLILIGVLWDGRGFCCAEVIFSITLSTNLFLVSSSTRF